MSTGLSDSHKQRLMNTIRHVSRPDQAHESPSQIQESRKPGFVPSLTSKRSISENLPKANVSRKSSISDLLARLTTPTQASKNKMKSVPEQGSVSNTQTPKVTIKQKSPSNKKSDPKHIKISKPISAPSTARSDRPFITPSPTVTSRRAISSGSGSGSGNGSAGSTGSTGSSANHATRKPKPKLKVKPNSLRVKTNMSPPSLPEFPSSGGGSSTNSPSQKSFLQFPDSGISTPVLETAKQVAITGYKSPKKSSQFMAETDSLSSDGPGTPVSKFSFNSISSFEVQEKLLLDNEALKMEISNNEQLIRHLKREQIEREEAASAERFTYNQQLNRVTDENEHLRKLVLDLEGSLAEHKISMEEKHIEIYELQRKIKKLSMKMEPNASIISSPTSGNQNSPHFKNQSYSGNGFDATECEGKPRNLLTPPSSDDETRF